MAPEGVSFNREEILQKINFQEKFFDGELLEEGKFHTDGSY